MEQVNNQIKNNVVIMQAIMIMLRQMLLPNLQLIFPHKASINQVLQVWEPFLDPEADRPHGHAVGQQHVPDDVPPHQPLPLILTRTG